MRAVGTRDVDRRLTGAPPRAGAAARRVARRPPGARRAARAFRGLLASRRLARHALSPTTLPTLVAFGAASSCSTCFGYAPAPQKRLRRRLELHGARVSLIDEFRTSQMCSCCGSRLQDVFAPLHPKREGVPESPGRRGIVHAVKRCGECARVVAADGARHARYVHRDVNAACNIAHVYVALAKHRERPVPFGRSDTAGG